MTKVTINGKEYTVKFSMRTAIRYERKTGNKLGEFINAKSDDETENVFDMIDIMLEMAGAPLIEDLSLQDFEATIPACMKEINNFINPQAGDSLNAPEAEESETPEKEKN